MKNLKIVHTSDTHLGTDWKPELEKKAFRAILNGAIDLDADVVPVSYTHLPQPTTREV